MIQLRKINSVEYQILIWMHTQHTHTMHVHYLFIFLFAFKCHIVSVYHQKLHLEIVKTGYVMHKNMLAKRHL